jgi:L-aspartate oxidase
MARTVYRKACSLPNVTFRSYAATTGLCVAERACGATILDATSGTESAIPAAAVLLATGGLGGVFLNTTNPDVATGDGVAMAYRAGAEISDIEFVQFHPTALALEGAPRFLLSEALRGEGAVLKNVLGQRFTDELAPRDVVARAIVAEMQKTQAAHVFLDLTHRGESFIRTRFPRIYETCLRYGVDIGREAAPVAPAAHYAMGGVWTDLEGRSTVPGLFAAGEVACTGVHGANRLASNSLLEALVFGARAGRAMRESGKADLPDCDFPKQPSFSAQSASEQLRRIAWENCGIIRSAEGLQEACVRLETLDPDSVALLIARCALARQESRGAHFRIDFPHKDPAFEKHSVIRKGAGVSFR